MKFEYDLNKSKLNLQKHGVGFEEAKLMWLNDNAIIGARAAGEERFMIIGKIMEEVYSCIFTVRGSNVRIISCRKSKRKERKIYHEKVE